MEPFSYVWLTDGDGGANPQAPQEVAAARERGLVGFAHKYDPAGSLDGSSLNLAMMAASCGNTRLPIALYFDEPDALGWQSLAHDMMMFALSVEGWTNYIVHPRSILVVSDAYRAALAPLGFPWGRWWWGTDGGGLVSGSLTAPTFNGTDAEWAEFAGRP